MGGRIRRSVQEALDGTPEMARAAGDLHHLVIGPGAALEAEWIAAGLDLPDLPAMRQPASMRRRHEGVRLRRCPGDGSDEHPVCVRHHQHAVVGHAQRCPLRVRERRGYVIVWDYEGCEFLSGHSHVVNEVRPAIGATYFLAGSRHEEQARRMAAEMVDVVAEHCGPNARIAVDQCHYVGYKEFERAGWTIENGTELMEQARKIKGPTRSRRCALGRLQAAMYDMQQQMQPE